MASGPITSWQIGGEKVEILLASKMAADGDCNQETKRHLFFGRKATTDLDSVWKSRDIHFADKGPCSQSYSFSSSHVWMWELNYKEGWEPKKCYFQIVVLEKTLKSPLDCKEIKPVHPKGNQWIFIRRIDTETETPILWPPDMKSSLIGKYPDAVKDWGQEKNGVTEDEMVGWHYWLSGHEFEQTPGDSEGQGSLVCYSSWGGKEEDMT